MLCLFSLYFYTLSLALALYQSVWHFCACQTYLHIWLEFSISSIMGFLSVWIIFYRSFLCLFLLTRQRCSWDWMAKAAETKATDRQSESGERNGTKEFENTEWVGCCDLKMEKAAATHVGSHQGTFFFQKEIQDRPKKCAAKRTQFPQFHGRGK